MVYLRYAGPDIPRQGAHRHSLAYRRASEAVQGWEQLSRALSFSQ